MLDPRRPAWPSGERTPGPGTDALFPGIWAHAVPRGQRAPGKEGWPE